MVHPSTLSTCVAENPRGLSAGKAGKVEHPRACISGFPAVLLNKTGFFERHIIVPDIYLWGREIGLLSFPEF